MHLTRSFWALGWLSAVARAGITAAPDPCLAIAGKEWVLPREARACMSAFPLDPVIKANVIEVVNKTLAFHTSVNYQIQAPHPFELDVHEDLAADLIRINQQSYPSDFDFHLDMYRSFKRVNDGHCGVFNYCYDGLYLTYLPLPLALLTGKDNSQHVYITPEAFKVASREFEGEIEFWQQALPGHLKGQLASLSGAQVLLINGVDPFLAVNNNTKTTGGFQSFATRQNAFFSSYARGPKGWNYAFGNFALHTHPLVDSVELTVRRVNSTVDETFSLPYRSRFGSDSIKFTDAASYRANNCMPINVTNGADLYSDTKASKSAQTPSAIAHFQQQPRVNPGDVRKQAINVLLDGTPPSDIELPEELRPNMPALNQSYSVAQFYLLNDKITGVLALGSFSAENFTTLGLSLLSGLQELKASGAKQLIVDVTNNGGGYICIAHWLHRIIIGPKNSTEPQAGLDTTVRAGPMARLIVKAIADGRDPDQLSAYNPIRWTNASNDASHWFKPISLTINGHKDYFSQRLGQECQPFAWDAPTSALFDPKDVLIVSNGRCASSCSLFSITMAKEEGVRTVVVGGKSDIPQQYCGTVGGESTDFVMVDTEIKTAKLKKHELAPPDFLTNSAQGITWRLGYGVDNPKEPEEWQMHAADIAFPLTAETVSNPVAIWESLVRQHLQSAS